MNINVIKGQLKPIKNRVIVKDMHFGEQHTRNGLIILDDNGTNEGIYPRWGCVHSKGPDNTDPYQVGDWVLVEHGRWTRGINLDEGDGEQVLRMVEAESIMLYTHTKPEGVQKRYGD